MMVTGALSEPMKMSPFGTGIGQFGRRDSPHRLPRPGLRGGRSAAGTPAPTRVKAAPANSNSRRLSVTGRLLFEREKPRNCWLRMWH